MRTQTEVQDRLIVAKAIFKDALDDLRGLLEGTTTWACDKPTAAELAHRAEMAAKEVVLLKWMLGRE